MTIENLIEALSYTSDGSLKVVRIDGAYHVYYITAELFPPLNFWEANGNGKIVDEFVEGGIPVAVKNGIIEIAEKNDEKKRYWISEKQQTREKCEIVLRSYEAWLKGESKGIVHETLKKNDERYESEDIEIEWSGLSTEDAERKMEEMIKKNIGAPSIYL